MSAPVTIVARVLAATGDALLVDDGTDRRIWVPSALARVVPMGEPLPAGRRPELSETEYVEVVVPPDLAATLGLAA